MNKKESKKEEILTIPKFLVTKKFLFDFLKKTRRNFRLLISKEPMNPMFQKLQQATLRKKIKTMLRRKPKSKKTVKVFFPINSYIFKNSAIKFQANETTSKKRQNILCKRKKL